MAKGKNKKMPSAESAGGIHYPFVQRLSNLLEEKYGRRIPQDFHELVDVLSRPQELVCKDQSSPVLPKSNKNFRPERVLEELLDELSAEDLLRLVPDTANEAKEFRSFISQCKMARDEDTIWRRITGYSNVNREWVGALASLLQGKNCMEIMAGNGLLSRLLQDAGAKIMATDIAPGRANDYISMRDHAFTDVMAMDAVSAVRKFGRSMDILLCSWPPQGEEEVMKAFEAFQRIRPEGRMIYIGEWKGGYNATDAFFEGVCVEDMLEGINALHIRHPGSKDVIRLVSGK